MVTVANEAKFGLPLAPFLPLTYEQGDPMAQLVWRWSCQRWQTAGGGSNPCWSTRESQVRPAERQRAPNTKIPLTYEQQCR